MKKIIVPLFAIFFTLTSCELVNQLVPDVETKLVQTYLVTIDEDAPAGVTDTSLIDIADYPEFQDYEQYVNGYSIDSIAYEILEYNAPDDLYFSASINAFDVDEVTEVTVGDIQSVSLLELSNETEPTLITQDEVAIDQLLSWLDDPGTFNVNCEFGFENMDGTDYSFAAEDIGSTFKIKVTFYLLINTGI